MAYASVYLDLSDFDDDDLLEEVEERLQNNLFENAIKEMLQKNEDVELYEELSSIHNWENKSFAKEWFERLPFAGSLKDWILKTYGAENETHTNQQTKSK